MLLVGVALAESSDGLGQNYITPESAVGHNSTDIIIVGRAILKVSSMSSTLTQTIIHQSCVSDYS